MKKGLYIIRHRFPERGPFDGRQVESKRTWTDKRGYRWMETKYILNGRRVTELTALDVKFESQP